VFDELNRRKAIVYSHPTGPNCCVNLEAGIAPGTVEFMFDTTRAIVSYLFNGTFARCPDIRFIFSHGGGATPMLAGRFSGIAERAKNAAEIAPHGVAHELGKLRFDTASMANAASFAALSKIVPLSQVFFGTDFPYVPIEGNKKPLENLGLGAADLRAIEYGNAKRFFPRFQV
jgi:predicted TIM-barrel fold metal-dependent hydrolase